MAELEPPVRVQLARLAAHDVVFALIAGRVDLDDGDACHAALDVSRSDIHHVVGVAGIAAGILTFVWPVKTAIILLLFIACWAIVAGVMAAKRTHELIPLCHPLALTSVAVDLAVDARRNAVDITATCKLKGQTGVEMEALTAVAVAALTVYDMCKAVDRAMTIAAIRLVRKSGGRSGDFKAE